MTCWIVFVPSPTAYYSSLLPLVFVCGAPRALIAKTESNQSQGRHSTLLKVLYSCLMSWYRWEGRCLRLRTSTFKPCHIIYQLGSGPESVDGVKAVFLEPTLGGIYHERFANLLEIYPNQITRCFQWSAVRGEWLVEAHAMATIRTHQMQNI